MFYKHVVHQDLKHVLDLINFAFLHLVYSYFLQKGPRRGVHLAMISARIV